MRTTIRIPSRLPVGLAALICSVPPLAAFAHGGPNYPPHLSPAHPATLIGSCEALQAQLAGLANTVITGATTIAAGTLQVAGQPVLAHCRVTGRMNDRVGIDGRPYSIGFELRLPIEWNGRFWYQGNGGIDGSVVPSAAAGSIPFMPREVLRVLRTIKDRYGSRAWSKYGFVNAFNPLTNWYDDYVIGIDTGITLLMAENVRTGFVWNTFMKNAEATHGMQRAGFASYEP